ncbi:MAG TPA: hypothetical protein VIF11_15745 [Methylomirabilota bacterium]
MKTIAALAIAVLSAVAVAGCGGDPPLTDCTPGACPVTYPNNDCPDSERLPSYCPGETPAETSPDGGAR